MPRNGCRAKNGGCTADTSPRSRLKWSTGWADGWPMVPPLNERRKSIMECLGLLVVLLCLGTGLAACTNAAGVSGFGSGPSLPTACPSTSVINTAFGFSISANTDTPTTISSSIDSTGCDYGDGSEQSSYASVSWSRNPPQPLATSTPVSGLGPDASYITDESGYPMVSFIGSNGEGLLIQSTGTLDQDVSLAHTLLTMGY